MGSAVQHLSLNTFCPVIMIKDRTIRSEKKGGKIRWAVCTDGSEKSMKAFTVLSKIMDKSKDEVVAITVATRTLDIDSIRTKIEN